MYLQQIFSTPTQGCQYISRPSPPHCLSPPTRDAGIVFHCRRNLGRWGWQKSTKGHGIGYLLLRCVEQTFLCCTDDVPPATLIVNPIVPRCNCGWGQAPPATAPTPQQSTIPHDNQRSTTLISPSIHAHDHQLAVYDPEDHLGSDKPCIDRVVRCQCCINKCDRRALCRRALCRQVTKPIRHDLPNLAGLHGSVN